MTHLASETYLAFIALGFGVGAYGTLIGAGGGFVLMPILLLLFPEKSPELLTSISLAIVFLNALSGSGAYAFMRRIDYKSGLLFAVATIPGAILGALNTSGVPRRLFDTIFGIMLLAASVFLSLRPNLAEASRHVYHPDKHQMLRHLVEADGVSFDYAFNPWVGVVLSLFVGYVSSFLGIGGGIIHVPALVYFLNFPIHVATATSHFILVIMALTGTIVHIVNGTFGQGVHHMISLAIGVVLGAQVGARLSQFLKGVWIIRSLAVALGLVGIRILMLVIAARV
jgi:uncharacterized membrane protein YfcA